jgi:hypothetical protein
LSLRVENLAYIEERMGKIIEYFAFGSGKGGNLESILAEIKGKGKVRWLVAKFISQKLKKDFHGNGSKTIEIKGQKIQEFQDLLKYLISDCEEIIYWTCPYTPDEWFKEVDIITNSEWKRTRENYKSFKLDDFPLLKEYSNANVKKFRFVNLSPNQFNKLTGNSMEEDYTPEDLLKDFLYFLKFNDKCIKDCDLIFINLGELTDRIKKSFLNKDIGIYDEEVIIGFKKETDKEVGSISLTLGCDEYILFIEEFTKFRNEENRHGFYYSNEILEKIQNNHSELQINKEYKSILGKKAPKTIN